jgi:phosphohistidine swiveling domain-containing protein
MSTTVIEDPTTSTSEPGRYWTTANIGEATPDVLSPLCWSFWGPNMEAAARQSYHDFGILSRKELAVPEDPNQLLTSHFHGRPAMNLDLLRALFGSLPGMSADDFERDICGKVRPGLADEKRTARLPFIIARGPVAMATTGKLLVTLDELSGALPANARQVVAFRRARRAEYRLLDLPLTFTGNPVPERIGDLEVSDDVVVKGVAGATGSVEGIARVVTDPDNADSLADGEILVCRFTDPSWAPLFLFASAVVIDIGASASHGAIVARELGIPCVIGTGDGTRRIRSGDRIAVDGAIGEVRILKRADELG